MTAAHAHDGFEAVVVGLGNKDRGDDAVGAAVAHAVDALHLPGVSVIEHEDPTALLDLWEGRDLAVIADAVTSGAEAGTIHWIRTGPERPPLSPRARGRTAGGTHAIGVAEVVELARALGRLPARVVLVGIEAARFDHGEPLTPSVAASIDDAVRRIREMLQAVSQGCAADVPR